MKNRSFISILLLLISMTWTFSSCEDMLTTDSDRKVYVPAQDTLYTYWGIMKSMQNIAERQVVLNEVRGDLVSPAQISDSIAAIANFENPEDGSCRYLNVMDYYKIINNCNTYLAYADTMKTSTGNKIMIKEYAQVATIRAWTYLQLVKLYGKVPFYTEPIISLDFVDHFDFENPENFVDATNIADKLVKTIQSFVETPYPSYGNYNNGSVTIHSELTMLPVRLVIGDLYLTSGNFTQAAQAYYDYLKDTKSYLPTSYNSVVERRSSGNTERYVYSGGSNKFNETGRPQSSTEAITVIPSAANKLYGNIQTGICNLYGWEVTTNISVDDASNNAGGGTSTSVASVSVWPNVKMKEVTVSNAYLRLCKEQSYAVNDGQDKADYYLGAGDARQSGFLEDDINGYFVSKQCQDGFSYTYPIIYRKALVWLRFAEAINRAGFPAYAFAILKDGLCQEYLPRYVVNQVPVLNGDESTATKDTLVYTADDKVCYYIPKEEYDLAVDSISPTGNVVTWKVPFLNFTSDFTYTITNSDSGQDEVSNIGVHARGCNFIKGDADTMYTYKRMVNLKLQRAGLSTTIDNAEQEDIINAVEDLIVDELALELAFEGHRFTDLVRIASHRSNGDAWLAKKIAGRSYSEEGEYDANLQGLLMNKATWYLKLPAE